MNLWGPKDRLWCAESKISHTSLPSGVHRLCDSGAVNVDFTA